MPVIDLRRPEGKYGGSARAVADLFNTLGAYEKSRRELQLQDSFLKMAAETDELGKSKYTYEDIVSRLIQQQANPTYSPGFAGAMQRLGGVFASQARSPVMDILTTETIRSVGPVSKYARRSAELDVQLKEERLRREKEDKGFGTVPWYLRPDWINTPEGKDAREKAMKGMSDLDQLKLWRGIQSSAEGQYFYPGGLESGAKEPKNKALYDLASKNVDEIINKMKGGVETPTETTAIQPKLPEAQIEEVEPETVEEFEQKVEELKTIDMKKAREYYDKWVSKWR